MFELAFQLRSFWLQRFEVFSSLTTMLPTRLPEETARNTAGGGEINKTCGKEGGTYFFISVMKSNMGYFPRPGSEIGSRDLTLPLQAPLPTKTPMIT